MIRKAIVASLTIAGLLVAVAWATSFYSYDPEVDRPSRLHSHHWYANEKRACYWVTSLRGWLRFGTLHQTDRSELTQLSDRDTAPWRGFRAWPYPEQAPTYLGGLVVAIFDGHANGSEGDRRRC